MNNLIKFIGLMSIFDGIWTLFGGKILIRSEGWVHPSVKYSIITILIGIIILFFSRNKDE